jgi:hypothetical protein
MGKNDIRNIASPESLLEKAIGPTLLLSGWQASILGKIGQRPFKANSTFS